MQGYLSYFKNQIVPYLGSVKVQKLTPIMLDKWVHNLRKAGLSRNTISAVRSFINHALNYAVYPAQLISSNPVAAIKVPKNAPRNVIKRHIITPERFAVLLEKYPFGSPYHIPLMLLYHTGMRISEALSLSWSDVDFAKKRINLWRQIKYIARKGHYFTTLKNKASERYILIGNYLLTELRRWKARQAENEKALGGRYFCICREDNGHVIQQQKICPAPPGEKLALVCTWENGRALFKESFSKMLRKEGLNAHSFRHTHTTILAEIGVPAKAIAGRLCHADTQITQNLYTHNTPYSTGALPAPFALKAAQQQARLNVAPFRINRRALQYRRAVKILITPVAENICAGYPLCVFCFRE